MPTASQQQSPEPAWRQPTAAQPPGRPQLRRFLRTAAAWAVLFLTVMVFRSPNAVTTWLDVWAWAMFTGVIAGLCAVWWNRSASRKRSRIWGFITDMTAIGFSAGFLSSLLRRRLYRGKRLGLPMQGRGAAVAWRVSGVMALRGTRSA
jgi:hypothetical protein